MKKTLLLFFGFLLFCNIPSAYAQCYGTVHFDQSVAPLPVSSSNISYTINSTYCNEIIMIGYDGFTFTPGDTGEGPVTVDGNAATWINTSYTKQLANSYWETAETWAYFAPTAGAHTINCTETGYSCNTSYDYGLNFAADFFATGSVNPMSIASLTTTETTSSCNSGGPITDNITTTIPNSAIYSNVLYNDVTSADDPVTFTGANFLNDLHAGDGIEAAQAYTSAVTAGLYSITATSTFPSNSSYCTGIQMILVDIPPPLCTPSSLIITSLDVDPTCGASNGSISLTVGGGTAPYTYSWAPPLSTTSIATGLSAGTYTILISDGACPPQDTLVTIILSNGGTQITEGVTAQVECYGSCTGTATVTATGGILPYTYSWTPLGGTTANATGLCAGTFTISVSDNSGCTNTATITITQPPIFATTVAVTNPQCGGGTGSIAATTTGGTVPYTYSWSPSGQTGATAAGLSAGVYTITVTDNRGCSATASGTITEPAILGVSVTGPSTLCASGTATLTATVNGGTAPYNYAWNTGGTSSTLSITFTSTQTYSVTVTDANGCSASGTILVTLAEPPTITVTASQTSICAGTSVILQASATNITSPYSWQPGSMTGPNITVTPSVTTTYIVTASSACGTATANITITINAIPVPSFSADIDNGCAPLCIQFRDRSTISSGIISNWGWSFGNGDTVSQKSPIFCYPKAGIYSVNLTVISDDGCSANLSISNMITAYSNPVASFIAAPQPATILQPTIQFTNQSTDNYGSIGWNWNFGEPGDTISTLENPSHVYLDTGTYCPVLIAINEHGCTDTATNCLVINPIFTCYIPDAFSPNSDGMNDEFTVKGNGIRKFEMYIYDRWGLQLFHTTELEKGWNGESTAGALAQQDSYVYLITVYDNKDLKHTFMGTVNLIR